MNSDAICILGCAFLFADTEQVAGFARIRLL